MTHSLQPGPEAIVGNPHQALIDWGDNLNGEVRITPPLRDPSDQEFLSDYAPTGHFIAHRVSTCGATVLRLGLVDHESGAIDRAETRRSIGLLIGELDNIENGTGQWYVENTR